MVRLHPDVLSDRMEIMEREQAWTHYFNTGDREPLVKAYWHSIEQIAWYHYRDHKEDYLQIGMMGLLKAIDRIDVQRVKSKDAWVWLNVKGMMFNKKPPKRTLPLQGFALDDESERDSIADKNDPFTEVEFDMLLGGLTARQRVILSLIYRHDWDRTQIAKLFNLSSMRIGQIEKEALEYLRPSVR